MATNPSSHPSSLPATKEKQDERDYEETLKKYLHLLRCLPRDEGWTAKDLIQYQGFWFSPMTAFKGVMVAQDHFKAQPTDIFLASFPKSGTTWLKALAFALSTRTQFDPSTHPLRVTGPHACVPFIEEYYEYDNLNHPSAKFDNFLSHRLLATHIAYDLLPKSVIGSGSRIVYVCRNPKDVLVSMWCFTQKVRPKETQSLTLAHAFELFCRGVINYGPFWDHIIGYYKASLEQPDKVLFLKYEDMKRHPLSYVKKMAGFLGSPFTSEEERKGIVEEIVELCSFESLSSFEVNKNGVQRFANQLEVENRNFFRKGKVGDWKNKLTAEMIKEFDRINKEKFDSFGLTFEE